MLLVCHEYWCRKLAVRVLDRPGRGWGWSRGRLVILVWIGAKISHAVVVDVDVLLLLWCDDNNQTQDQKSAVRHKKGKKRVWPDVRQKRSAKIKGSNPYVHKNTCIKDLFHLRNTT